MQQGPYRPQRCGLHSQPAQSLHRGSREGSQCGVTDDPAGLKAQHGRCALGACGLTDACASGTAHRNTMGPTHQAH